MDRLPLPEGVLLNMGSSGGPLMEIENVESHEESRQETLAMGEGLTIQERDLEAMLVAGAKAMGKDTRGHNVGRLERRAHEC